MKEPGNIIEIMRKKSWQRSVKMSFNAFFSWKILIMSACEKSL